MGGWVNLLMKCPAYRWQAVVALVPRFVFPSLLLTLLLLLSNFVTMIDLARASVLRLDLRPPAPIFLPPFVLHMLNACRPWWCNLIHQRMSTISSWAKYSNANNRAIDRFATPLMSRVHACVYSILCASMCMCMVLNVILYKICCSTAFQAYAVAREERQQRFPPGPGPFLLLLSFQV